MKATSSMSRAAIATLRALNKDGHKFDPSDAAAMRRLLPYQSVLGIDIPFAAMTYGLVETDDDEDSNAVAWGFRD